jgi:hypothetical protein
LPALAGSLPAKIVFGKLPKTAGWQPALPGFYSAQNSDTKFSLSFLFFVVNFIAQ